MEKMTGEYDKDFFKEIQLDSMSFLTESDSPMEFPEAHFPGLR